MSSPSSSNRRFLLGLDMFTAGASWSLTLLLVILVRLAGGGPSKLVISSSSAGRFRGGVAGVGLSGGLSVRGGQGKGEGRMRAGPSLGWFALQALPRFISLDGRRGHLHQ